MNVGDIVWRVAQTARVRDGLAHAVTVTHPERSHTSLAARALCGFRPRRYWSTREPRVGSTACHRCVKVYERNNEPKET